MSTKSETAVSRDEARRLAMEAVRFNLGTYLRIDDGEFDEEEVRYEFTITLRSPKLILDDSNENAVDLRYLDSLDVGTVTVDATDKDVDYPTKGQVKRRLESYEKELNQAVQKAVIRASGSSLSHLPFPENQYAPLQDILSEVILNGEIPVASLQMMDKYDGEDSVKYQKYIDDLVELDLLKRSGDILESGDVLNTIQNKDKFQGHEIETHQDALNAALGRYFEHNVGEFEMVKRTLKPYLALSGYYYRRALELGDLPTIKEQDMRDGILAEYSGRDQQKKLFKMSRYLVQLEDVGVLTSVYQNGERYWVGNDSTFNRIKETANQLGPITELFSPSLTEQQTFDGMSD